MRGVLNEFNETLLAPGFFKIPLHPYLTVVKTDGIKLFKLKIPYAPDLIKTMNIKTKALARV